MPSLEQVRLKLLEVEVRVVKAQLEETQERLSLGEPVDEGEEKGFRGELENAAKRFKVGQEKCGVDGSLSGSTPALNAAFATAAVPAAAVANPAGSSAAVAFPPLVPSTSVGLGAQQGSMPDGSTLQQYYQYMLQIQQMQLLQQQQNQQTPSVPPTAGALPGQTSILSQLGLHAQGSASGVHMPGGIPAGEAEIGEWAEDKVTLLEAAEKSAKEAAKKTNAYVGVLARFDYQKGYGFVSCEETHVRFGKDIFLAREHLGSAEVQDSIIFSIGFNDKGPRAQQVRRLPDLTRRRKDLEVEQAMKKSGLTLQGNSPGKIPAAMLGPMPQPTPLRPSPVPPGLVSSGTSAAAPLGGMSLGSTPFSGLSPLVGSGGLLSPRGGMMPPMGGMAPGGMPLGLSMSMPGLQGLGLQSGMAMRPAGMIQGVSRTL